MQHEVGEQAEAGGLGAEDAFAEGDALEALGFCLLPFFVTDAAFWADENGDLFCLRQCWQKGIQGAAACFVLVGDEFDVGIADGVESAGKGLHAVHLRNNAALGLAGGAFADFVQAFGFAIGFFFIDAHIAACHHDRHNVVSAQFDSFLNDELELLAFGQSLQKHKLTGKFIFAGAGFKTFGSDGALVGGDHFKEMLTAAAVGEEKLFAFAQAQHEEMLVFFAGKHERRLERVVAQWFVEKKLMHDKLLC